MHFVKAKEILFAENGMNLYRGCSHGCIFRRLLTIRKIIFFFFKRRIEITSRLFSLAAAGNIFTVFSNTLQLYKSEF